MSSDQTRFLDVNGLQWYVTASTSGVWVAYWSDPKDPDDRVTLCVPLANAAQLATAILRAANHARRVQSVRPLPSDEPLGADNGEWFLRQVRGEMEFSKTPPGTGEG
jgi:hypothetical protein